jgi:hypothetical protein
LSPLSLHGIVPQLDLLFQENAEGAFLSSLIPQRGEGARVYLFLQMPSLFTQDVINRYKQSEKGKAFPEDCQRRKQIS